LSSIAIRAYWNSQNPESNGSPTKAGTPTNKANGNYQLGIPFNDSRELIMDILKHGAKVEVKTSGFLREAVIQKIAVMQKNINNKSQPHVLRLSVWIMVITLSVGMVKRSNCRKRKNTNTSAAMRIKEFESTIHF
jgi:hypothetical protein